MSIHLHSILKTGFRRFIFLQTLACLFGSNLGLKAQFDPKAGSVGSKAVSKDSSVFLYWATQASIIRGFQDISQTNLGLASVGNETMALGKAGSNGVVSLGDGGSAVLEFSRKIKNGPGPDFAVFENSFDGAFLELAFVEVSSDGHRFVRFPAISNTDTNVQVGGFGTVDPTKINNLAGKYMVGYGTPFDLEELIDSLGLDIKAISHVRIIDVVGTLDKRFASKDSRRFPVNDPWPTPFPSSGFDLDAIGVIHGESSAALTWQEKTEHKMYRGGNPTQASRIEIIDVKVSSAKAYSTHGQSIELNIEDEQYLNIGSLPPSVYQIMIVDDRKEVHVFPLCVGLK